MPLQIARRKLSGMRDSLVAGSTWRPNFRKALDTYPDLDVHGLEFTVLGCAACNLGGRKSTLQGRLSGEPYDKLTYQVCLFATHYTRSSHRPIAHRRGGTE